jgi:hypothetical protein
VERCGRYPEFLDPATGFDGSVLYEQGNEFLVLTKVESSMMQFQELETQRFARLEDAIPYVLKKVFSKGIDNIQVQW